MKRVLRVCISALFALNVIIGPAAIAESFSGMEYADKTAKYLRETVTLPGITQTGGDWTVFGLARYGGDIGEEYFKAYYTNAVNTLKKSGGVLSENKYSEYSRAILALTAIGADPRNVGGYDLITPILDFDKTIYQGINGPMFALLALRAAGFESEPVCERYVEYILAKRLSDGGFALSGDISDPDTTAMALTALSGYKNRADVEAAIESGLARLSNLQRTTGGYTSYSLINSESVSQVIIALCSLGISYDDERFVKEGNTLLDNLLTYYVPGGGFEHEHGDGGSIMATEQAMLALTALSRAERGKNSLYDLGDAISIEFETTGNNGNINVPDVIYPDIVFPDAAGHENAEAIDALARRGIVTGYPGGLFMPDETITRAEFAAIVVRALGLAQMGDIAFGDVAPISWYYDAVRTAYGFGVVLGRSETEFDPGGVITRQEAALMLSRAAGLCGLGEELDEVAVRNVLSQFPDYRTAEEWSSEALAFCYNADIFDRSDIYIRPAEPMLRAEMAQAVFRTLNAAGLIG